MPHTLILATLTLLDADYLLNEDKRQCPER
jgi:hypothetical protein